MAPWLLLYHYSLSTVERDFAYISTQDLPITIFIRIWRSHQNLHNNNLKTTWQWVQSSTYESDMSVNMHVPWTLHLIRPFLGLVSIFTAQGLWTKSLTLQNQSLGWFPGRPEFIPLRGPARLFSICREFFPLQRICQIIQHLFIICCIHLLCSLTAVWSSNVMVIKDSFMTLIQEMYEIAEKSSPQHFER
jgi:hypothetical protein